MVRHREGKMMLWYNPICAASKRPEPILITLSEGCAAIPYREAIEKAAGGTDIWDQVLYSER
jgi:hypothetical protein